ASERTCRETSWLFSAYGRPRIIFVESASLTPGSAFSCSAVAELRSTRFAWGTTAALGAFGVAGMAGAIVPDGDVGLVGVVAGWANTGAATVSASRPRGS